LHPGQTKKKPKAAKIQTREEVKIIKSLKEMKVKEQEKEQEANQAVKKKENQSDVKKQVKFTEKSESDKPSKPVSRKSGKFKGFVKQVFARKSG